MSSLSAQPLHVCMALQVTVLVLLPVLSDCVSCSDEPSRPNGTARMCIEYEHEDPLSLKKPVNLLDALEHSEHSRRRDDEEKVPSPSVPRHLQRAG